ncbi:RecX family transcriptional regulator [Candidatus Poribacteria bacterium]|nr:RecX family transcriptional regulator [Candidatus Poribacteria bacterium]
MKQKIIDIQKHPKIASHHIIHFDNSHNLIIPSVLIDNFGLCIGLSIEKKIIEKLIAADEAMRAKNIALSVLKERIYSKSQMVTYLEREGFTDNTIQQIVIELIQSGHIKDREFAVKWINRRQKSNPRGNSLLKQELLEKGVDRDTVDQVFSKLDERDDTDLVLQIAEKRSKAYRNLPVQTARRRLHAYLARRGFDSDIILEVMEQVL